MERKRSRLRRRDDGPCGKGPNPGWEDARTLGKKEEGRRKKEGERRKKKEERRKDGRLERCSNRNRSGCWWDNCELLRSGRGVGFAGEMTGLAEKAQPRGEEATTGGKKEEERRKKEEERRKKKEERRKEKGELR